VIASLEQRNLLPNSHVDEDGLYSGFAVLPKTGDAEPVDRVKPGWVENGWERSAPAQFRPGDGKTSRFG